MDRFDRLTDRARRVLTFAQDEAMRFNHNYIGTEHILLGLIRVDDGVAANVLGHLDVDLAKVRMAVEFIIGRGDRPIVGEVGLTPHAKRVIELSIDEARRLGHRYIGTEHLLLALVREGEGIAAGVLASLGVNLDRVRREVIRHVAEGSPAEPASTADERFMVVPAPLPVDDADRVLEISQWYVDVGASPLERVVGIGLVGRNAGIAVELIALEIRAAGCVLYWKAHSEGSGPRVRLDCVVRDDDGTEYRAQPTDWTASGGEVKGEIVVVPGPPVEATTMQVELTGFAIGRLPPSNGGEEVRGTWVFEFPIRP